MHVNIDSNRHLNAVKLDRDKTEGLFQNILAAEDEALAFDIFFYLKTYLTTHIATLQESIYSRYLDLFDLHPGLDAGRRAHERMALLLDQATESRGQHGLFLQITQELRDLVNHHIESEEEGFVDFIRNQSREEISAMSRAYLFKKQEVQEKLAGQTVTSPVSQLI